MHFIKSKMIFISLTGYQCYILDAEKIRIPYVILWMFCTLPGVEFAACTHLLGSAQKLDEHFCVKTMDNWTQPPKLHKTPRDVYIPKCW